MPRVLVLVQRPVQLTFEETEAWLRAAARQLGGLPAAERVELVALESASLRWPRPCDWLIEVSLADASDVSELLRCNACSDLLGDLRMLGMRPAVAVAGSAA
jgi:hypothetical protein